MCLRQSTLHAISSVVSELTVSFSFSFSFPFPFPFPFSFSFSFTLTLAFPFPFPFPFTLTLTISFLLATTRAEITYSDKQVGVDTRNTI
eukprot:jgi/Hompol1/2622/HPOL_006082-RA